MFYPRRVYVIELDDPMIVYVGETGLPIKKRFDNHLTGYKSSKHVRKAISPRLRPDLYEHLPTYATSNESRIAEAKLAAKLKKQGFTVFGGH